MEKPAGPVRQQRLTWLIGVGWLIGLVAQVATRLWSGYMGVSPPQSRDVVSPGGSSKKAGENRTTMPGPRATSRTAVIRPMSLPPVRTALAWRSSRMISSSRRIVDTDDWAR